MVPYSTHKAEHFTHHRYTNQPDKDPDFIVSGMRHGFLAGGIFTAYWFAYRPHLPYQEPARYRNTNSLIMPVWMKPLEWFWLGQNLHSIHHAFPRVPFYHYHALFREIEPIMRAHGAPVIGIFDRRPVRA